MKHVPLEERIIMALDVSTPDEAMNWVKRLEGHTRFFKVGLELFLAGGFSVVDRILERGNRVMLDLKFFDIPETVQRAVALLAGRGITYATVHGNDPILRAAVSARNDVKILAVTVLTSFDDADMREMGMTRTVEELVAIRAKRAVELGCDGVVASAREAKRLRDALGHGFSIVTPGIRPSPDAGVDDQRRVTTAQQAFLDGADHVVVGRPIRNAPDPAAVVDAMKKEITSALEGSRACLTTSSS